MIFQRVAIRDPGRVVSTIDNLSWWKSHFLIVVSGGELENMSGFDFKHISLETACEGRNTKGRLKAGWRRVPVVYDVLSRLTILNTNLLELLSSRIGFKALSYLQVKYVAYDPIDRKTPSWDCTFTHSHCKDLWRLRAFTPQDHWAPHHHVSCRRQLKPLWYNPVECESEMNPPAAPDYMTRNKKPLRTQFTRPGLLALTLPAEPPAMMIN